MELIYICWNILRTNFKKWHYSLFGWKNKVKEKRVRGKIFYSFDGRKECWMNESELKMSGSEMNFLLEVKVDRMWKGTCIFF
jgi:hypothetical protein